ELGQAFRGEHAEIMPFVEKTIDSELSGNIIDLCPVGALTSKPFRFAARTWELSRRRSVSPHDSLGSNLIVQVKHDAVKRVLPLENEAVNECWISDRDRFSYEALNTDERLTAPMIKQGGEWREVDWQMALEYVANGLKGVVRDHGADAIGVLASPQSTLEELHLLQKLARGLGCENIDSRLRQADFSADATRQGAPWLGMPIAEVGELNRLLVVGSFLRKDHPLLAQRVRQGAKRGLKVSAIGCAGDDWLIKLSQRLTVKPSALVATLAAVAKALASEVSKPVHEALASSVAAAEPCDTAKAIAAELASGKKVAVWLGNLAAQHPQAAAIQSLAQQIADLCDGRFGVIGDAANSVGAAAVGAVPQGKGLNAAAMLAKPRTAYVVFGAEGASDFANGHQTLHALGTAETVVHLGAFKCHEALAYADVMLPIAPFTETSGTFVNCEGRAQSFHGVVKGQGQSRPGWKVLRVLGNMLGLAGFEFAKSEEVRDEALSGTPMAERLGGRIDPVAAVSPKVEQAGFERIADIPLYSADPIVRRAPSLQRTKDAKVGAAWFNAQSLAAVGVAEGASVRLKTPTGDVVLPAALDSTLPDACVRLPGAQAATAELGALTGLISVERA
ncbi:MAG: molybdopterin-dependent oxidoreductase, partial [Rhodocyclaceae bacterium]|nr:molybdopterin-dependent oxidoreductase [Rhodocyclaceae bacterium]